VLEMLDCPFCGDTAELQHIYPDGTLEYYYHIFYVQCSCGACGPRAANEKWAIRLWNKRFPLTPTDKNGIVLVDSEGREGNGKADTGRKDAERP